MQENRRTVIGLPFRLQVRFSLSKKATQLRIFALCPFFKTHACVWNFYMKFLNFPVLFLASWVCIHVYTVFHFRKMSVAINFIVLFLFKTYCTKKKDCNSSLIGYNVIVREYQTLIKHVSVLTI